MTSRTKVIGIIGALVLAWAGYTYWPYLIGLYYLQQRPEWVDNPRPSPFVGNARIVYPPVETRRPNLDVMLVGHRGAMLAAPENTLPSTQAAVDKGFDFVEADVRYSSDGVPVLMHDRRLHRTTNGEGYIDSYTYAELSTLDAGSSFSPDFAGTRIPRLDEVISAIDGRACLYWHVKSSVEKTAIDQVTEYQRNGGCVLVLPPVEDGFVNPNVTETFAQYWPEVPLVLPLRAAEDLPELLRDYPNARAVWVMPNRLETGLVDAAHAEGLLVVVYLLDRRDTSEFYEAAVAEGVDLIVLDNIDEFRAWRDGQMTSVSSVQP